MPDINELIKKKLETYPSEICEVAIKALELAESGLPEVSIAEHIGNVIRRLVKKKGDSE
jgi:hypothetical protein